MTNHKLITMILIIIALMVFSIKFFYKEIQEDRVETIPVQGHVLHSLHEEDMAMMALGESGDE